MLELQKKLLDRLVPSSAYLLRPGEALCELKAIILTESLSSDASKLNANLLRVKSIFKQLPVQSILVIGTKGSKFCDEEKQTKRHFVEKTMEKNGIPKGQYLQFQTPYKYLEQDKIPAHQFKELAKIIDKCEVMPFVSLNQIQREIHDKIMKNYCEKNQFNIQECEKYFNDKNKYKN